MRWLVASAALLSVLSSGCKTSYTWTSSVPQEMRTVSVPTFSNASQVTELGSVVTRQMLREIQREGTFKVSNSDDAAVEIQGEIKSAGVGSGYGDRRTGLRLSEYSFNITATVSIVDRRRGRVLVDNKVFNGRTTFVSSEDMLTGERNASGRAADDLAQQVVDYLTSMQW